MRSLSAHHFRLARQTLSPARTYRHEMDTVVAEIGIHQPLHPAAPPGMLVLASDLGLCGDYNARLSRLAVAEAQAYGVRTVYSMGRRSRGTLVRNGLPPDRVYDAPASLTGLSRLLVDLAQDVLEDYSLAKIGSLRVISAGFDGVGHFTPLSIRVLPIEPVAPAKPLRRSTYVDPSHLTSVAVREFLYITLFEILLEALAAEHGMRLMAAESALEWLDATAATTSRRLASARGEAATQELLDIVSGSRQRFRAEST
jgi:F-type H+-transporting ATPase subunit gamma